MLVRQKQRLTRKLSEISRHGEVEGGGKGLSVDRKNRAKHSRQKGEIQARFLTRGKRGRASRKK